MWASIVGRSRFTLAEPEQDRCENMLVTYKPPRSWPAARARPRAKFSACAKAE